MNHALKLWFRSACGSHLQPVVLPVGMEEHAIVHLTLLTATVPVGTQDPTARTEVFTHNQENVCSN